MDTVFNFIFTFNLNYGYLSFIIDCYYLKGNTTVNNLAACVIFVKCHIYNVSDSIGQVFFRVLLFYLTYTNVSWLASIFS